jgi:hypothetical protein
LSASLPQPPHPPQAPHAPPPYGVAAAVTAAARAVGRHATWPTARAAREPNVFGWWATFAEVTGPPPPPFGLAGVPPPEDQPQPRSVSPSLPGLPGAPPAEGQPWSRDVLLLDG